MNRLRNVSASIIERAKRSLVKYTILQRIVLSALSVDNSPWIKVGKIAINIFFAFVLAREAFGSVKQTILCPRIQGGYMMMMMRISRNDTAGR